MGGIVKSVGKKLGIIKKPPRQAPPPVTYTPEQVDQLGRNAAADINFRRSLQGLPPLEGPTKTLSGSGPTSVEPAEPINPRDVVYGDEGEQGARRVRRRRTRRGTMLTGGKGVLGDAPVEKKTLLGS